MKLQIGRFGLALASGEVESASTSGSGLTFKGRTAYSNLEESLALRQQLLGYVDNPDEAFVPVVWGEYPGFDGFYRVGGVSVDAKRGLGPLGKIDFSVSLDRVQGYAAPLIENTVVGRLRSDDAGVFPRRVVGLPASVKSVDWLTGGVRIPSTPDYSRVGESGTALIYAAIDEDAPLWSYYVDPAGFYEAASTLFIGDPQRIAVGRQIPNFVDDWALSNELLQIRPSFADGTFVLKFRMWLAATSEWSVWEPFGFGYGFASDTNRVNAPHTITVMRNSPEAVSIRLLAALDRNPVAIDITLRRGARYASIVFNQIMGTFPSIDPPGTPITTTAGCYWYRTGYSCFVASPVDINAGPSKISPVNSSDGDTWHFCIGLTNPAGPADDITRSIGEYFWAGTEKQSVVAQ